ncbi:MAG: glycosyltransferase family 9 protein [Proteobacteria bacterium]|nr:glycosyltransferase family 9 protein [Pseudomonadota bacterium]MDA1057057.1 glycosyltransferase family 9 protein [Pseudomonadota bacterium]
MADHKRILVIKHSALGDFVMALGPFRAIRTHHPDAHITLLTTAPYADLGHGCGWFDAVEVDPKPHILQWRSWLRLRRFIIGSGFDRVYDLQHSNRTHMYFRFFRQPKPEWSGIAPGCSHPHRNPNRNVLHTLERQAEQLAAAGIAQTPAPDLDWLTGNTTTFGIAGRFALLVPGGAPHRPDKRWPPAHYGAVARALADAGIVPFVIGTQAEAAEIRAVAESEPRAVDLMGQTSFGQIAELARHASVAIGNDTGPMHIIAAAGCASVSLFSHASVPAQTQPRGPAVVVIQRESLADLDPAAVLEAAQAIAKKT